MDDSREEGTQPTIKDLVFATSNLQQSLDRLNTLAVAVVQLQSSVDRLEKRLATQDDDVTVESKSTARFYSFHRIHTHTPTPIKTSFNNYILIPNYFLTSYRKLLGWSLCLAAFLCRHTSLRHNQDTNAGCGEGGRDWAWVVLHPRMGRNERAWGSQGLG